MTGSLYIQEQDRFRVLELSTQSEVAYHQYQGPGGGAKSLRFNWAGRQGTWRVSCSPSERMTVNGRGTESNYLLGNDDVITWEGTTFCFRRIAEPVRLGGVVVSDIPLYQDTLYLGRSVENEVALNKADLDPHYGDISRLHASVTAEGNDFVLRDLSTAGSALLNGRTVFEEKLVYGDRIQISDYTFEFTGDSLRQIFPHRQGSLVAEGLQVNVRAGASVKTILAGVTANVDNGEFIGILGGSGQGKSTLLKALCGINDPDAGTLTIGGVTSKGRDRSGSLVVGYVPQDDTVHRELTVEEALQFSARLRLTLPEHQQNALIDQVLNQLALSEHRGKRISLLSGGQRKRVSIGIELLIKPKVLFLDEPSSGLDPATEGDLMELLQQLCLTGMTVICTTHVLQKAYLFDRLWWIHGGRLIFDGTVVEAREFFLGHTQSRSSASQLYSPLESIYSLVLKSHKPAIKWEEEYHAFRAAQNSLLAIRRECDRVQGDPVEQSARVRRPSALRIVRLLIHRQWRILMSDRVNLLFLLCQSMLIGAAIGWVAHTPPLHWFLSIVGVFWFGCSNAAQQIVSELPILKRETLAGLGRRTYLHSKLLFLGGTVLVQTVLLASVAGSSAALFHPVKFDAKSILENVDDVRIAGDQEGGEIDQLEPEAALAPNWAARARLGKPTSTLEQPEWPPMSTLGKWCVAASAWMFSLQKNIADSAPSDLKGSRGETLYDAKGKPIKWQEVGIANVITTCAGLRGGGLILTALTGVFFGLAASVWAKSTVQAVMWVPLLLIPQILLAGIVVTLPEMLFSARLVSDSIPCSAAQRIIEVSQLYGQTVPPMTNRTKVPVFLSGHDETVEWEHNGQKAFENYPEISSTNNSWQNQIVEPSRLGKRHSEREEVSGELRYAEDVRSRDDLRPDFRRGVVFTSLHPAWTGVYCLMAWMAVMYSLILWGLRSRLAET